MYIFFIILLLTLKLLAFVTKFDLKKFLGNTNETDLENLKKMQSDEIIDLKNPTTLKLMKIILTTVSMFIGGLLLIIFNLYGLFTKYWILHLYLIVESLLYSKIKNRWVTKSIWIVDTIILIYIVLSYFGLVQYIF